MQCAKEKQFIMMVLAKANEQGKKLMDIARDHNLDANNITKWMKAEALPGKDEMVALSEALGLPLDELKKLAKKTGITECTSTDIPLPESNPTVKPVADTAVKTTVKAVEKKVTPTALKKEEKAKMETNTILTHDRKKETPETGIFVGMKDTKESLTETETSTASKKEESSVPVPAKPERAVKEEKVAPERKKRTKKDKEAVFSEDNEALIRKTAGLKKSDELTKEALQDTVKNLMLQTKTNLVALERIEKDLVKAVFAKQETPEPAPMDERTKKLVEAAAKASDEGYDMALAILRKFKK